MSTAKSTPSTARPPLSLETVILILSDQTRWAILEELGSGEPRMVNELAAAVKKSKTSVSKHLSLLRTLRLVKLTRRAYQLTEGFRPAAGQTEIDFGYCVMRFPGSVR